MHRVWSDIWIRVWQRFPRTQRGGMRMQRQPLRRIPYAQEPLRENANVSVAQSRPARAVPGSYRNRGCRRKPF